MNMNNNAQVRVEATFESQPSEAGREASTQADKVNRKAPGAFRTISEVADDLNVQQHVLRFWETKFSQVRPLKRGGGRRYYRPEDVTLLKHIHHLLYTEGYTIKGVQKLLKGQGRQQIIAAQEPENENVPETRAASAAPAAPAGGLQKPFNPRQKAILESMLGELKDLRALLEPVSE